MRPEAESANDSFIHELRDTGTSEINLVSRMGMYRAKEVDRYITHLQDQLHGMTAVYQDRFEEMRTSLLGMTRERDEKIVQIRDLEKKLTDTQDLDKVLANRGLSALPSGELLHLRQDNIQLNQKVSQLTAQIEDNTEKKMILEELQRAKEQLDTRTATISEISEELASVKARRNELQLIADDQKKSIEFLTDDRDNMLERYKTTLEEIAVLQQHLASHQQTSSEHQIQLEAVSMQLHNLEESLAQSRAQYQTLEAQHQISQDLANRLLTERSTLENEIRLQNQRFEVQREMLISRYQGILDTQNEFLKKWRESFNTSVRYLEELAVTDLARVMESDFVKPSANPGRVSEVSADNPEAQTEES